MISQPVQRPVQTEERVLNGIFGTFPVAQQQLGHPHERHGVLSVQAMDEIVGVACAKRRVKLRTRTDRDHFVRTDAGWLTPLPGHRVQWRPPSVPTASRQAQPRRSSVRPVLVCI